MPTIGVPALQTIVVLVSELTVHGTSPIDMLTAVESEPNSIPVRDHQNFFYVIMYNEIKEKKICTIY